MGHASADTTLNVYTQVMDGSVRAAANEIGTELFTHQKATMRYLIEKNGVPCRTRTRGLPAYSPPTPQE